MLTNFAVNFCTRLELTGTFIGQCRFLEMSIVKNSKKSRKVSEISLDPGFLFEIWVGKKNNFRKIGVEKLDMSLSQKFQIVKIKLCSLCWLKSPRWESRLKNVYGKSWFFLFFYQSMPMFKKQISNMTGPERDQITDSGFPVRFLEEF